MITVILNLASDLYDKDFAVLLFQILDDYQNQPSPKISKCFYHSHTPLVNP